jgi:hypothetical protein
MLAHFLQAKITKNDETARSKCQQGCACIQMNGHNMKGRVDNCNVIFISMTDSLSSILFVQGALGENKKFEWWVG